MIPRVADNPFEQVKVANFIVGSLDKLEGLAQEDKTLFLACTELTLKKLNQFFVS